MKVNDNIQLNKYGKYMEKEKDLISTFEKDEFKNLMKKRPIRYLYFDILRNDTSTSYILAKKNLFLFSLPLFILCILLDFVYKSLYLSKIHIIGADFESFSSLLSNWLDLKTIYWIITDLYFILLLPCIFFVYYWLLRGDNEFTYLLGIFFYGLVFYIIFNHLIKILIVIFLVPDITVATNFVGPVGDSFLDFQTNYSNGFASYSNYSFLLHSLSFILMSWFIAKNLLLRNDIFFSTVTKQYEFKEVTFRHYLGTFIVLITFYYFGYLFLLIGHYGFF